MTFTPTAPPMKNQWGNWSTKGVRSFTGQACGGAGDPAVKNADGSTPANPPPPITPAQPIQNPAPKTCGGVSCYDPNAGKFCGTVDGAQVCVPAPVPGTGNSGGSCASSGNATLCAGSSQPPSPPPANVPNPPAQTTGHDDYTGANPTTGAIGNIGVGMYMNGPGTSSSGATTGDSGPAPASTSAGAPGDKKDDGTGASGGGDCSNPPAVSGSPALGMIAQQEWLHRCADLANSIKQSDVDSLDKTPGDQTGNPNSVFKDGDDGSSPGGILGSLDSSGFLGGARVCPGFAPIVYFGQTMDYSAGICQTAGLLAAWVYASGFLLAAIIIYRGRAS